MYAVNVVDGLSAQVIVGDASWASSRLGGLWVQSDVLVGIGWAWEDGVFVPPQVVVEP